MLQQKIQRNLSPAKNINPSPKIIMRSSEATSLRNERNNHDSIDPIIRKGNRRNRGRTDPPIEGRSDECVE